MSQLKILIAEDSRTDRALLTKLLQKQGHEVLAVEDGLAALEAFREWEPSIILLDAMMPKMTGLEVAKKIKSEQGDVWVPIIFLTSLSEPKELAACLEVGGDDFLTKPYHATILNAKVHALDRARSLHDMVMSQRDQIQYHTDRLVREQEVAKRVFDNIAHPGCLDAPYLSHMLSPMSFFNGDILIAANKPSGGAHIFLGDFTGHGLPAAVGAMPVSEVFYSMTQKGFSFGEILSEINGKLCDVLPTGVFCCALAIEIDWRHQRLNIWNAGMPAGLMIDRDLGLKQSFQSKYLPLGVSRTAGCETSPDMCDYTSSDRLYLFSDGIIEASNAQGEMFGQERFEQLLVSANSNDQDIFSSIRPSLREFCQTSEQDDDLTLLEINFDRLTDIQADDLAKPAVVEGKPFDWALDYAFFPETLKQFNPIPMILQNLMSCPGLPVHRGPIFTILSELFHNALDHGVLNLDSSLKQNPAGFSDYYTMRQARLDALESGYIKISLKVSPTETGGALTLEITDSGNGFDVETVKASMRQAEQDAHYYAGRGLHIINKLCQNVDILDSGKRIIATYFWQ